MADLPPAGHVVNHLLLEERSPTALDPIKRMSSSPPGVPGQALFWLARIGAWYSLGAERGRPSVL